MVDSRSGSEGRVEGPERGLGLGTGPVFLASISTILGAILFLRFGWAVGNVGLVGALAIVILGHGVTIPTALAIAEIATNRRVEGGGEYFIISRSFGPAIGGAIGISLYLSQAISVAFYMIAFAEAFRPLVPLLESVFPVAFDPRMISFPATAALAGLVVTRGADLGVKALWGVAALIFTALVLFFFGGGEVASGGAFPGLAGVEGAEPFMLVFAVCFPAFTGMTAGVGLSGDLRNPGRSIPFGVLSATVVGLVIYVAVVFKFASAATPEVLAGDPLVMGRIALWDPIVPIGLAAACLSSAIGSILVAPRTLQALAGDRIVPAEGPNRFLAEGRGEAAEPRNATLVTAALALVFVAMGSVDMVARVVSMFFMVTYGALCAISFLEHFAARPSYRPVFRSRWWASGFGALLCLFLMFQMDPGFAFASVGVMVALYIVIRRTREDGREDLAAIFHGVATQATRRLQIHLQRNPGEDWRPSVVLITSRTFDRSSPLQLLSWVGDRYGVGTYLHFLQDRLTPETYRESQEIQNRLLQRVEGRAEGIFVDTIVSPSLESALAQTVQVPGVSGVENNTLLLEFSTHDGPEVLDEVFRGTELASVTRMNRLVLRHGDRYFGNRREIHVWLTWHDVRNANLLILLAYILLGHEDWEGAEIRVYAAFPREEAERRTLQLHGLIAEGRVPIAPQNVRIVPTDDDVDFQALVRETSAGADLVLLGFTQRRLRERGPELLLRHPDLGDLLWVAAGERIDLE